MQGVSGIEAKVASAQQIGIRRLLVARDNFEEATSVAGGNLIVLPVDHVREVRGSSSSRCRRLKLDIPP